MIKVPREIIKEMIEDLKPEALMEYNPTHSIEYRKKIIRKSELYKKLKFLIGE
jgi:hypothetical protein